MKRLFGFAVMLSCAAALSLGNASAAFAVTESAEAQIQEIADTDTTNTENIGAETAAEENREAEAAAAEEAAAAAEAAKSEAEAAAEENVQNNKEAIRVLKEALDILESANIINDRLYNDTKYRYELLTTGSSSVESERAVFLKNYELIQKKSTILALK